ncbi:hypothetical protein B0T19DRAFT_397363 [Cercophora scortea]|uniref:Uncharacterized protein n=1 Tax=Cercophora scortea TaxID=314031 RepID=A0AAE0J6H9_9PEZI|nr:hypothetical protein B0T19DRAFT_397363 [Cercophora scortea]
MDPSSPHHSEHESDTVFGSDNELESEPIPPPNTPTRRLSSFESTVAYLSKPSSNSEVPLPPTPVHDTTNAGEENHLGRQPVTPEAAAAPSQTMNRYQAAAAEEAYQQTAAAIEATLSLKRQLGIAPSHDHHTSDNAHHQHPPFVPQDQGYIHPPLPNYQSTMQMYPPQYIPAYYHPHPHPQVHPQHPSTARKATIQAQIDAVYARIGATQIQRNQAEDRRRYYAAEAQRLRDELGDHMAVLARLKAQKRTVGRPGGFDRWLGQGGRQGQAQAGWNGNGKGKKWRQFGNLKGEDYCDDNTGERPQVSHGFTGGDEEVPDAVLKAWREKIQQGKKVAAGS